MPDYSRFYTAEVTNQTFAELVDFIKWYNKLGHEPLIVGGWAAWAYHRGLGSKDIDVVFPGAASMHLTLFQYFKANGYKERKTTFFTNEFYKIRTTQDGREVEIIVDAVSSDRRVIVKGTPLVIPWGLAEKHKRKHYFAPEAHAWIVEPELLTVYKIGALIGRSGNLSVAVPTEIERIEGKLWKDARDLLGVFNNTEVGAEKLLKLIKECGFNPKLLTEAKETALQFLEEKEKEALAKHWNNLVSKQT